MAMLQKDSAKSRQGNGGIERGALSATDVVPELQQHVTWMGMVCDTTTTDALPTVERKACESRFHCGGRPDMGGIENRG